MWLTKTVAKLVVLMVVAVGLLGASSANAVPARPAFPLAPSQTGDFAVDSFFDITYRIDFVGAPGSALDGMAGTTVDARRIFAEAGGGSGGTCIVPDNGTGTADLPPAGCIYHSPGDPWLITDGLPPATTIQIDAVILDFLNIVRSAGGPLGGEIQEYDATMVLPMVGTGDLTGFNRTILMDVAVETLSGPRTPGDPIQTFDREMVSLQGSIFGDPDFDQLVITLGTEHGLPGPGETTLTEEEEIDYGDAPDPTYPTLSANNGAGHVIVPGFHLGQMIDPEPDGQPNSLALGDDNDTLYPPPNDDEDGITFTSALLMGQTACMDVVLTDSSGSGGLLDAWIDFDVNGIWDPHEHLFGGPSQLLIGGNNNLCFDVPPATPWGPTYARFRLSRTGGLLPDGLAPDGEVEDYEVWIESEGLKWSQPPILDPAGECFWGWDEFSVYDSPPPVPADGSPPHIVADDWLCQDDRPVTDIHWWGSYEGWFDFDPPIEPPPPPNAPIAFHIGIWTDVPANPPDVPWSRPDTMIWEMRVPKDEILEESVGCDLYPPLMAQPDTCFRYDYEIPQEHWFYQQPGPTVYWISIAAIYDLPPEQHFWGWTTREHFWNDDAVRIFNPTAPTMGAPFLDGEPIHHPEEISWDMAFELTTQDIEELDFGDAPDSPAAPGYPTLLGNSAASHVIVPNGPFMGSTPVDAETDGQPDSDATGDDLDGNDDEDGVTFGVLAAGNAAADITIQLSNAADCMVNAWIDFDGDGTWSMGGTEQILTDVSMTAGSTVTHNFPVPLNAKVGVDSYARVRCDSAGGLTPSGPANDGEVEDYKVEIDGYDYGDAPDPPYSTLHATIPTGAAHVIDPDFLLGTLIDADWDGQPDADAEGDDNTNLNDEDGIFFLNPLIPGQQACIQVDVINNTSFNASLAAWIDFNGNGTWETAEHLFDPISGASEPLPATSNIKCFLVPSTAKAGPTFGRFRLDSGVTNPTPYGLWVDGEVEDYKVHIAAKKWDQPPILSNEDPYPECFWGWDEISEYEFGPIVADDWLCEDDRPVSDIHWWGSYVGWAEDFPPTYAPREFHIGIWTDIPAGVDAPWSHPGEMIREWKVSRDALGERVVGCDFHPSAPVPDTCFAYDFEILSKDDWFFQDPGPTVYWLSIAAIYESEPPQDFAWGWKTRPHNWNDAAIRMFDPLSPIPGAQYGAGEPIMLNEEPWDMAFIITTQPGPPEAPDVDIAIVATDDAELSWPHVEYDIYGNPVTVTEYRIYRSTAPYFITGPGNLHGPLNGPFSSGPIAWVDPNKIGDPTVNYYYFVVAVTQDINGNDIPSQNSNHVGEFDFALVPGVAP